MTTKFKQLETFTRCFYQESVFDRYNYNNTNRGAL